MWGGGGIWRAGAVVLALLAHPVRAQDTAEGAPVPGGPASVAILTLDEDRLFFESQFGRRVLDRERAATAELEAENARIEQELISEEQSLTELRKTLPAEDFAARARAFDEKVERIRDEQDAKSRDLTLQREEERKAFLRIAVPVLGELMAEKGAVAIVNQSSIILSLTAIDITDEAIARVDQADPTPAPSP